jgi:hypothetical protein
MYLLNVESAFCVIAVDHGGVEFCVALVVADFKP